MSSIQAAPPIPTGQPATATADLALLVSTDPTTGGLVSDFGYAPSGDLAVVVGAARLIQRIQLWLLIEQGSDPTAPRAGNPSYGLIGQVGNTPDFYLSLVDQCEAYFLSEQQSEIQLGTISADETVDHFANEQVTQTSPSQITLSFTVITASGVQINTSTSFSYLGV